MKELCKAPAVIDFLKRKRATDNEDYKTKRKRVETNLDKKGRKVFATEAELRKARAALNDGYWFLQKKPEGATDELIPQYFVDFCVETKRKLIESGDPPDTVMISCSAWARDAGALQSEADVLVHELTQVCVCAWIYPHVNRTDILMQSSFPPLIPLVALLTRNHRPVCYVRNCCRRRRARSNQQPSRTHITPCCPLDQAMRDCLLV